ncbi:hypothetical protein GOBAR_AA16735 [Gossypium barbadense]|uniref:RRM domain-containing protein n=1 Tax=Gossypium barbadense TaxID=3634 RepID=A0A2P5XKR2_GOSBA|nr:hypothetical protein GOBAR_AA16735 [Gossypium barbadense]
MKTLIFRSCDKARANGMDSRFSQATDNHQKFFIAFIGSSNKGISRLIVKKFFEKYGNDGDVYMVFHSLRRRDKETTFAFVRFKYKVGLEKAVNEGNHIVQNGFCLRVFKAFD